MKVKYLRLTKEEKQNVKNEYYKTDKGLYIKKKLRTTLICGILCILIGLYIFIGSIINNKTWDLFYGIIIVIFGIFFIIETRIIFVKKINKYVVSK